MSSRGERGREVASDMDDDGAVREICDLILEAQGHTQRLLREVLEP